MSSGRSAGQKHPGRASPLHLALDAGASQGGTVAVETGDDVQDLQSALNEEILGVIEKDLIKKPH